MDPISMALNTQLVNNMNRVMMDSSARMTNLADNLLKTGVELALKGREMGKGELLDLMA